MINSNFEIVDMGDETIAVPVGESTSLLKGVLKLNSEGRELFVLLQTNSVNNTIQILSTKYDNNNEEIEKYVMNFVETLRCNGIVVE